MTVLPGCVPLPTQAAAEIASNAATVAKGRRIVQALTPGQRSYTTATEVFVW